MKKEIDTRPSAASALAIAILEEQIRETGELIIHGPGQVIKLGPDDLQEDFREEFLRRQAKPSGEKP